MDDSLNRKLRWGVLGVARIATKKVIPAMQKGRWTTVDAIASRDESKARAAAAELGIAKAYGSYDALVADPDIDAVYIPLPNHLHVDWTIRAAEAGKHVLCEKPIALIAADAERLLSVRDRTGVLIQEAFMVRTHPQWLGALEIAQSGRGALALPLRKRPIEHRRVDRPSRLWRCQQVFRDRREGMSRSPCHRQSSRGQPDLPLFP